MQHAPLCSSPDSFSSNQAIPPAIKAPSSDCSTPFFYDPAPVPCSRTWCVFVSSIIHPFIHISTALNVWGTSPLPSVDIIKLVGHARFTHQVSWSEVRVHWEKKRSCWSPGKFPFVDFFIEWFDGDFLYWWFYLTSMKTAAQRTIHSARNQSELETSDCFCWCQSRGNPHS